MTTDVKNDELVNALINATYNGLEILTIRIYSPYIQNPSFQNKSVTKNVLFNAEYVVDLIKSVVTEGYDAVMFDGLPNLAGAFSKDDSGADVEVCIDWCIERKDEITTLYKSGSWDGVDEGFHWKSIQSAILAGLYSVSFSGLSSLRNKFNLDGDDSVLLKRFLTTI